MLYTSAGPITLVADWYDFRDEDAGAEGATLRKYTFVREIEFTAYSATSRTLMLFMPEPLKVGSRIRDIRDRNGKQIGRVENGPVMTWEITTIIPVISPWGFVERIAMQAVRKE